MYECSDQHYQNEHAKGQWTAQGSNPSIVLAKHGASPDRFTRPWGISPSKSGVYPGQISPGRCFRKWDPSGDLPFVITNGRFPRVTMLLYHASVGKLSTVRARSNRRPAPPSWPSCARVSFCSGVSCARPPRFRKPCPQRPCPPAVVLLYRLRRPMAGHRIPRR